MAHTKTTLTYAQRGTKLLYLDHYASAVNARADSRGLRPCVIFVFGGGFATGTRDRDYYTPYFDMLCDAGCDVVSIDYRLGLAELASPSQEERREKMGLRQAIAIMTHSVNIAAEDALEATRFVLNNAEAWGIDPQRIVISGSSAGAIAALQAEYYICNREPAAAVLPEGFNYGGVISFAGAIYSTSGAPKWDSAPCPMLLFHGTSDGNVPYDKGSLMGIGMFGPATIVEGLEQLRVPYMFHSAEHKTHDMAVVPMIENHVEILEFIDRLVTAKQPIQRFMQVVDLTTPRGKRRFSVREYLTNNYGNDENDDKQ